MLPNTTVVLDLSTTRVYDGVFVYRAHCNSRISSGSPAGLHAIISLSCCGIIQSRTHPAGASETRVDGACLPVRPA